MNIEQIPVTPETLPSQKVVDFTRWALERNRQRQNERDRLRERATRPDDGPKDAA